MEDLDRYLASLEHRNLAERTIVQYRRHLQALAAAVDLATVTTEDIERWLDGRALSASSRANYIAGIAGFYRWRTRHIGSPDPTVALDRPKVPKGLPRPARTAELRSAIHRAPPTLRAWVCLAAFEGLRCCEIAGLSREDVDLEPSRPVLRLQLTKGRRHRVVPLNKATVEALVAHGLPERGPVFTDRQGRPFQAYEVSRQGCAFLRSVGITTGMHSLRHWFGTSLYRRTTNLLLVAQLMGHANVATTAGYAKVELDEAAFEAVEGLGA